MSYLAYLQSQKPGTTLYTRDDSSFARCVETWDARDGKPPTEAEYEAGTAAGAAIVARVLLRNERNRRLTASDRYALPDYPHANEEVRAAWLAYRQALRDLPGVTIDPSNPEWPTPPQ